MTRPVVSKFLAFFLFMLQAGPAQSTQDRPAVASERAPRLSPMADSEVHFDTVSEEKAWAQVTDSTHVRRVLLAKKFLDSHPTSPAAGQAHYMIATDSYRQQRFDEFIVHAEAALNLIAVTRLHQKVRRLQLQAQLAFYYAESGRPARDCRA